MLLTVTLAVCSNAEADPIAKGLVEDGLSARVDILPTAARRTGSPDTSSPVVLLIYGNVSSESLVLQRLRASARTARPVALTLPVADAGGEFWRWVDELTDVDTPLAID